MPDRTTNRISRFVTDFPWIHTGLGLLGNFSFFVGSICFLWSGLIQEVGVWLFIVGSAGMLIGSLGDAFVKYERHKLNI